ncbi:hypothetical protein PIIN_06271 [Serendipita indica DSM 11827]|uniref:F-box domain-containing protein n=1 Tax=Serendipita indica (strain DSM 11827) TaxID=1109443 RepID=G4TLZ4_SERID|nr:hypothetical protein PIIN_06271 [Serendipita indica DSM 11827]
MHLVTKIQGRKYRQRLKKETWDINKRLQLPVEILEQIIAHVDDQETLFTLCRVSRTLKSLTVPVAYHTIKFKLDFQRLAGSIRLIKALSRLNPSTLIVELDITMYKSTLDTYNGDRPISPRTYNRAEKIVGDIAARLLNLEVLKLNCDLTLTTIPLSIFSLDFPRGGYASYICVVIAIGRQ